MVRPCSPHNSRHPGPVVSAKHHRGGTSREHPFPMSSIPEEDGKCDYYNGQEPMESTTLTSPSHRSLPPDNNRHLSSWSIASITPSIPDSDFSGQPSDKRGYALLGRRSGVCVLFGPSHRDRLVLRIYDVKEEGGLQEPNQPDDQRIAFQKRCAFIPV